MENATVVTLKKGEGRTIKAGGLWIFDNEIDKITGTFKNGAVVDVEDFDGYPMGKGFINQNSKIRVRMLTRNPEEEVDEALFTKRVQRAWDYRKAVMNGCGYSFPSGVEDLRFTEELSDGAGISGDLEGLDSLEEEEPLGLGIGRTGNGDLNCCRVIFGEADFLPGLTVDKYCDVLVVECLALGMEQFKEQILTLLREAMEKDGIFIRAIYERSDAKEREKEGLPKVKQLLWSQGNAPFDPQVEIQENGIRYVVDVENGQKTGFFLDQKYNRLAMQRLVYNLCHSAGPNEIPLHALGGIFHREDEGPVGNSLRVLDCFTHMGTFALNCARAGANEVTGLDISEFAVQQATENAQKNDLDQHVHFRVANVLDELPRLAEAGEKYDVLILDPPAFTKSREATKNAIKGYREINMKGLKLVKDGGYFATCSCSHFMTQELFTKTVKEAAKAVHKRLRQVEFRTQSPDHPILWTDAPGVPESYYLKFLIFQVCEEK